MGISFFTDAGLIHNGVIPRYCSQKAFNILTDDGTTEDMTIFVMSVSWMPLSANKARARILNSSVVVSLMVLIRQSWVNVSFS